LPLRRNQESRNAADTVQPTSLQGHRAVRLSTTPGYSPRFAPAIHLGSDPCSEELRHVCSDQHARRHRRDARRDARHARDIGDAEVLDADHPQLEANEHRRVTTPSAMSCYGRLLPGSVVRSSSKHGRSPTVWKRNQSSSGMIRPCRSSVTTTISTSVNKSMPPSVLAGNGVAHGGSADRAERLLHVVLVDPAAPEGAAGANPEHRLTSKQGQEPAVVGIVAGAPLRKSGNVADGGHWPRTGPPSLASIFRNGRGVIPG
jgi:hypothetical protein